MRRSSALSLPHPKVLRSLTERVAWGEAAAEFDAADELILLPHAARFPQGEAYISYGTLPGHSTPSIAAPPGAMVDWSITERGVTTKGRVHLAADDGVASIQGGTWPKAAAQPRYAARADEVVRDGQAALWELVSALEPHVRSALEESNRYVAREIEGRGVDELDSTWEYVSNQGAVDPVTLEELAGELLYGRTKERRSRKAVYSKRDAPVARAMRELAEMESGEAPDDPDRRVELEALIAIGFQDEVRFEEHPAEVTSRADSTIIRMVRRSALTSINNQPLGSWWSRNVRPRAEEVIRRRIGDPQIGPKIRKFTRANFTLDPSISLDDILQAYRAAHPRDRAGRPRIIAAMTAGKLFEAVSGSLTPLLHVDDEQVMRGGEDPAA